eukprot:812399-Pelagomonas_calceolata.AAC.4
MSCCAMARQCQGMLTSYNQVTFRHALLSMRHKARHPEHPSTLYSSRLLGYIQGRIQNPLNRTGTVRQPIICLLFLHPLFQTAQGRQVANCSDWTPVASATSVPNWAKQASSQSF